MFWIVNSRSQGLSVTQLLKLAQDLKPIKYPMCGYYINLNSLLIEPSLQLKIWMNSRRKRLTFFMDNPNAKPQETKSFL